MENCNYDFKDLIAKAIVDLGVASCVLSQDESVTILQKIMTSLSKSDEKRSIQVVWGYLLYFASKLAAMSTDKGDGSMIGGDGKLSWAWVLYEKKSDNFSNNTGRSAYYFGKIWWKGSIWKNGCLSALHALCKMVIPEWFYLMGEHSPFFFLLTFLCKYIYM